MEGGSSHVPQGMESLGSDHSLWKKNVQSVKKKIDIISIGGAPSDLLCQATHESCGIQLFVLVVFVVCMLIILTELPECISPRKQFQAWAAQTCFLEIFLLAGTVSNTFSMFSTSFVEEEHQIFYFLATSIHILLLVQITILFLEGHRDKHLNTSKNTSAINSKKYAEINSCGENIYNCMQGNEVGGKTVDADKCINVPSKVSQSGDYSLHDTVELESSSTRIKSSKNSEQSNATLSAGVSVKGDLKESVYINLTEFLHISASLVGVLILLRILRRWNQTGNKWLDVPDFGDWLILPENKLVLSLVVVFSMMIIGASQGRHLKRVQSMSINLALTTAYLYRVAAGNLFFPSTWFLSPRGIIEARAALFFIGLTIVMSILPTNFFRLEPSTQNVPKKLPAIVGNTSQKKITGYSPVLQHSKQHLQNQPERKPLILGLKSKKDKFTLEHIQASSVTTRRPPGSSSVTSRRPPGSSSTSSQTREGEDQIIFSTHQRLRGVSSAFLCFMCVVMRPHNTVTVALMSLIEQMMMPILINCHMKANYILLYCLWMGQAFFFFQGNSNSLSTLDLTTGYTGLYEFTPAVTGTLLCLATYSGTIFWVLTYLRIVCLMCETEKKGSEYRLPAVLTRACSTLLLSRALPLSAYTALVSTQRYHLFVWTVFSPKLLYEGTNTFVVYVLALLLLVYSLFKS